MGGHQHHPHARALRPRCWRRFGRRWHGHAGHRGRPPRPALWGLRESPGRARQIKSAKAKGAPGLGGNAKLLGDLARGNGTNTDPHIRQDLVRLHTLGEIARFSNLRAKAAKKAGVDLPGMANIAKLSMSDMTRLSRDLSLRIVGASGMLHSYKGGDEAAAITEATGNPFLPMVTGMALWAQAPPIYGGTDQIQRNIISERVLGLPKEPGNEKTAPFKDLPRNQ